MQHRIENLNEKMLVGKSLQMSFANNRTFELWSGFMPRRKEITNAISTELYSLQTYAPGFFHPFDPMAKFGKWAAVEVSHFDAVPPEMETFILPAGLYAVFLYKGAAAEAAAAFGYIFAQWLPHSGYVLDDRPHFELLGEKYKHDSPDSEEEIWIPVKPQEK
jgi:AraC family transcriptional regulator